MKPFNLGLYPEDETMVDLFDEEGDFYGSYFFYRNGLENVSGKSEKWPKANRHEIYVPTFLMEGNCDLEENGELYVYPDEKYVWLPKPQITEEEFNEAFSKGKKKKEFFFTMKEIKDGIKHSVTKSLQDEELTDRLLDDIFKYGKGFSKKDLVEAELVGYFLKILTEHNVFWGGYFDAKLNSGEDLYRFDAIQNQDDLNDYIFNFIWQNL
jgi:hypothetical protein